MSPSKKRTDQQLELEAIGRNELRVSPLERSSANKNATLPSNKTSTALELSVGNEKISAKTMTEIDRKTRASRVGHYNTWSPEEDEKLKAVLAAGKGLTLAALKLKRTKGAVKQRAAKLRISIVDGRQLTDEAETFQVSS